MKKRFWPVMSFYLWNGPDAARHQCRVWVDTTPVLVVIGSIRIYGRSHFLVEGNKFLWKLSWPKSNGINTLVQKLCRQEELWGCFVGRAEMYTKASSKRKGCSSG